MLAVVNKCGCCVSVRRTRPRPVGRACEQAPPPPLSIGKLVKGYWGHMPPRSGGHCPLPLARLLRGAKSADSPARVARRAWDGHFPFGLNSQRGVPSVTTLSWNCSCYIRRLALCALTSGSRCSASDSTSGGSSIGRLFFGSNSCIFRSTASLAQKSSYGLLPTNKKASVAWRSAPHHEAFVSLRRNTPPPVKVLVPESARWAAKRDCEIQGIRRAAGHGAAAKGATETVPRTRRPSGQDWCWPPANRPHDCCRTRVGAGHRTLIHRLFIHRRVNPSNPIWKLPAKNPFTVI